MSAFEEALRELGLVDRTDPATHLVAKRIIELAQQGERDPIRLREATVQGGGPNASPRHKPCSQNANFTAR